MANKKKHTVIGIVSIVVAVLAVLLLVGIVLRFTNNGSEKFKTFYVERDGAKLLSSKSSMDVENGKDYRFDVKYTFGILSGSSREYTAKVIPNPDADFEFTAGDEIYTWQDVDLSSVFELKKDTTFFTVSIPNELTLLRLLEALYPSREITFDAATLPDGKLYSVIVSSDNGKVSYQIDFDIEGGSYVKVKDILLDKDSLVL